MEPAIDEEKNGDKSEQRPTTSQGDTALENTQA